MSDLPPAALAAALAFTQERGIVWLTEETVELLLSAAVPAIRADEREQAAQLAEREQATYRPVDTVPGVYDGRPFKPGPDPLGDSFAERIRTGRASATCQCHDEDCRYCADREEIPDAH